ncbi:polyphosphate kinase 1 [soil metagenome]
MDFDKDTLLENGLFRSKETSWLSFNARVLQEAENGEVPLLERIRFLGIYSSNLDEFFRVRVATLKRLVRLGKFYKKLGIPDPRKTLKEVNAIVHEQAERFTAAYAAALDGLEGHHIRLIDDTEIPPQLHDFLTDLFLTDVRPRMMPIIIKANSLLYGLKDHPMYLAIRMTKKGSKRHPGHALLEIPSNRLPRFITLPKIDGTQRIIYLDDVIRFGLSTIFSSLPFDTFESYAIKFTRDAEMEFDDDITESIYDKVAEGLRERELGNPVRLNYDANIPQPMLRMLLKKLRLTDDDTLFPGSRYHNRKDLMGFPAAGSPDLTYPDAPALRHPTLAPAEPAIMRKIRAGDVLLHFPYHSFNILLDLLREASIDPLVHRIYFTQYRLAKNSCVANALINAVKNGKEVIVMIEPRARFDEGQNIKYANAFQEAGIRVLLGVPGLKVHAKLCMICRTEQSKTRYYSCIGTGNFNEETARVYTDHLLLTAHQGIGTDIERAFRFFENSYRQPRLEHLIAPPHSLRPALAKWVETEIANAKAGLPAEIFIKINNLSDFEAVNLLYQASNAGVRVRLIIRSMFSLITGIDGASDHIKAISIVDRYLEHSRIFRFANGGSPRTFLSSADFLPRNFDSRFEVVCPVYDPKLQAELKEILELQWRDNVKARVLDPDLTNGFRKQKKKAPVVRSQSATREFLSGLLE